MNLERQDVDNIIKNFRVQPSKDNYLAIKNWYENNIYEYPDSEYLICVYLFLLGVNIKKRYEEITYEQHRAWIKEIRELVEEADYFNKTQRKMYLDMGTKLF